MQIFWRPACHYADITWASWCLKSLATRLFIQQLFRLTTKKTWKLRITGPLWRETTEDWWIPLIKLPNNAESASTSWHRHALYIYHLSTDLSIQYDLFQTEPRKLYKQAQTVWHWFSGMFALASISCIPRNFIHGQYSMRTLNPLSNTTLLQRRRTLHPCTLCSFVTALAALFVTL